MIVGIDPSLRCTGLALISRDGQVTASRIRTTAAPTLAEQSTQVRFIVGTVLRTIPRRLGLSVIEKPYVPHRHGAGDVVERAWLFGLLVDQLLQRGPVAVVSAAGRAKYGAGSGNATKPEVLAAIREAFPNVPVRDDNEADAIALASMGARYLGFPVDGVGTKKQLEAMTAVAWPVIERKTD